MIFTYGGGTVLTELASGNTFFRTSARTLWHTYVYTPYQSTIPFFHQGMIWAPDSQVSFIEAAFKYVFTLPSMCHGVPTVPTVAQSAKHQVVAENDKNCTNQQIPWRHEWTHLMCQVANCAHCAPLCYNFNKKPAKREAQVVAENGLINKSHQPIHPPSTWPLYRPSATQTSKPDIWYNPFI